METIKKQEVLTVIAWMIGFPMFCISMGLILMPQRNAIDDWWLYGVVMGFAFGCKWAHMRRKQKAEREAKSQQPTAASSDQHV